jgi:SAM-dependent methyltransferase
MRVTDVQIFACPSCQTSLRLKEGAQLRGEQIETGQLVCVRNEHHFEIRSFVPRFLLSHEVTLSFGFEWNRHPKTQFDSFNGMRISEERFFRETNWSRDLSGEKILEIGSGAGRFTEIALQTGADVFSIDASTAVEANWANNGQHPKFVLCQANLYALPFQTNYFDKVFCFGVLQHTPNVAAAFANIAKHVKPGGHLTIDAYNKDYWRNFHTPQYLIRPITKRLPHELLYRGISWWVPRLMPLSTWARKYIPLIGSRVGALIPISNYDGLLPTTSREVIEQYSILDTFDTLSPKYIQPQRPETVFNWFIEAGYENIEFDRGATFFMRGKKCSDEPRSTVEVERLSAETRPPFKSSHRGQALQNPS